MSQESKVPEKFYITTPIYYANGDPHIGHAYSTIAADTLARFNRFRGRDTFFLTGMDEHGAKNENAARAAGISPQEFVDQVAERFLRLWRRLDIRFDDFIRTTEPRHKRVVQEVFRRFYEQGDIYKSEYEGWYCTPCETFWPETKLVEGKCPDCEREVQRLKEESYFFRLSKYQDRLLAHIEAHPEFIQPESRRNEMVSFIKQGLEDLCVSRTTFHWGIPVPMDPRHVVYVWIDALTNYISAVGYLSGDPEEEKLFERYWPADVHLVGKEIVRFHTIIWPILLMALDVPLPETVFGHGWLIQESGKMSKSKGNVIDPHDLIDRYGADAVRYFLLREIPFGADGKYSEEAIINRTNVDLANDLGNLLHRTLSMLEKYRDGVVPRPSPQFDDGAPARLLGEVVPRVEKAMDSLEIPQALEAIWDLVNLGNHYIEDNAPWRLAKDPGQRARLDTVLYNLLETLRVLGGLLVPFLPETPRRIWRQLGLDEDPARSTWSEVTHWGGLEPGTVTRKGEPIFPRLDPEEVLAAARAGAGAGPSGGGTGTAPGQKDDGKENATRRRGGRKAVARQKGEGERVTITIDDLSRVELKTAVVKEAHRVEGADRLLRLIVDLGSERRQLVAGIAAHYEPEDLVGKTVVVVSNLKQATIRGVDSQGMLLAAAGDGELAVLTVDRAVAPGTPVR